MSPSPSPPVVVEMLDGMHAEASEWLDVRVPVVERVHVLVQRLRGDVVSLFVYDLVEFDKYCIRQQDPNIYSDTEARCLVYSSFKILPELQLQNLDQSAQSLNEKISNSNNLKKL